MKENIWKNTRHCHNLPCYQRQAVSIDSNNRCRTSQANATNNYYRQHGCLTLTRKEIAGRIDMTKKEHYDKHIFSLLADSPGVLSRSLGSLHICLGFQILSLCGWSSMGLDLLHFPFVD